MKKNKLLNIIISVCLGNICLAFCVNYFVLPHGFVLGGVTGLAMALQKIIPLQLTTVIYIVTIGVLICSYIGVGKEYFLSMLAASLTYPFFLSIIQMLDLFPSPLTNDTLLSAIIGGTLFGVGLGVILKSGAGSGGLDFIAIIVNKYTHISIAQILRAVDIIVILLQIPFSSFNQVLYGLVLIVICSIALNNVIVSGKSQVQLLIMSKKYDEILDSILKQIDVGATLLETESGYKKEKGKAILIVTSNRRIYTLLNIIHEIDATAFITISNTNEVLGRGFTIER